VLSYPLDLRFKVLESSFRIGKLADFSEDEEDLLVAGIIMMVLLERDRD
jgi:hypothetical protein